MKHLAMNRSVVSQSCKWTLLAVLLLSFLLPACKKDRDRGPYESDYHHNFDNGLSNLTFSVNGVEFAMVGVRGGDFYMGAQNAYPDSVGYDEEASLEESPVHRVTLNSFRIGQTEVTQELWEAVMGNNPSQFVAKRRPVENVSWNDAQAFVARLNELTGEHFRLPSEAEWEYAAFGGPRGQRSKYSGSDNIEDVAWFTANSDSTTHVVGAKQPNDLGLYDMTGNVMEWCADRYDAYPDGCVSNPTVTESTSGLVVGRGGSWLVQKRYCRVTHRGTGDPATGMGGNTGFRLAM